MKHRIGTYLLRQARHLVSAHKGTDPVHGKAQQEFLEVLQQNQLTLLQICCHYTDRTPERINDLYQEIACNLWESWHSFRGECSTTTWVRRVALNVAISQHRQLARQPQFEPLTNEILETVADGSIRSEDPPPNYYAIIDRLDPDERALLYLRLDRCSIKEIAQTLLISEAAVKQRFYRIRIKLDNLNKKSNNNEY